MPSDFYSRGKEQKIQYGEREVTEDWITAEMLEERTECSNNPLPKSKQYMILSKSTLY